MRRRITEREEGRIAVLRRLLRYAEKRFGIRQALTEVSDGRKKAQKCRGKLVWAMFVMTLCRFGSINLLVANRRRAFWGLRGCDAIPSARTIGRGAVSCDHDGIRELLRTIYRKMKRRKGLRSPFHPSLFALIIDGHECFCSYRRKWKGCLKRRIKTPRGERIQYYCRVVTAVLLCDDFVLLLDVEQQRPGEDEVACACRLFKRLMLNYPKAFDVVCADGLYAQQPFIKLVRKHRKHCIVVLKDERRDLLVQANKLFGSRKPTSLLREGGIQRRVWDLDVRASWAETKVSIRVVRSVELSYVQRQVSGEKEARTSEWVWATTLPRTMLSARRLITAGHRRWDIENKCFNELASTWCVNHAYTYDTTAVITFWLLTMIAYNLFHAFYWFNLKQPVREKNSKLLVAQMITAHFYYYNSG